MAATDERSCITINKHTKIFPSDLWLKPDTAPTRSQAQRNFDIEIFIEYVCLLSIMYLNLDVYQ